MMVLAWSLRAGDVIEHQGTIASVEVVAVGPFPSDRLGPEVVKLTLEDGRPMQFAGTDMVSIKRSP